MHIHSARAYCLVTLFLLLIAGCGVPATPVSVRTLLPTATPQLAPQDTPIVAVTPHVAVIMVRGIPITVTPDAHATQDSNPPAGTFDPALPLIRDGDRLFHTTATCYSCHDTTQGVRIVGPSLKGIGAQAASRLPGKSAAEYIRATILKPDLVVLDGYPTGIMPGNFATLLSSAQIDALVAYLLSL